jgi:hypothetical protein
LFPTFVNRRRMWATLRINSHLSAGRRGAKVGHPRFVFDPTLANGGRMYRLLAGRLGAVRENWRE